MTFRPENDYEGYVVLPEQQLQSEYGHIDIASVKLGVDNAVAPIFFKEINLTVHLENNSNHNKQEFLLNIMCNFFSQYADPSKVIIDTTFTFKASHLMPYTFSSTFINPGDTARINYKQTITTGNVDTTVNIINH